MKDGGGEPHLFHFAVTVQGANDDWTGEPFRLTVRAWNLQEACARAAEVPFPEWTMPPEDAAEIRMAEARSSAREDPWDVLRDARGGLPRSRVPGSRGQAVSACECGCAWRVHEQREPEWFWCTACLRSCYNE